MKTRNDVEAKLCAWLAENEQAMFSLLEEIVNIDGGSYDKAGVDAVGEALRRFLDEHEVISEIIPVDTYGDSLRATVPAAGAAGNKSILLMGHRDTVFPKGEPTRRPFTIKDGIGYGPGITDMKAGLVMNAFVLAAFAKHNAAPETLVGLFTGDEEIGSPASRPIIAAEARKAKVVFNSEPGRISGNVVTGRKGGMFFRCEIEGKAAHSGANFKDGVSAIAELAHKINAWHELTDFDKGITVNVGLVSGGQSVNTVSPNAACEIDTRFVSLADRYMLHAAITKIAEHAYVVGTKATLSSKGMFDPLEQSADSVALFENYIEAGADAGLAIQGEFSGGCADSGIAAAQGAATICGVGPVGHKVHSPEEFLMMDTMVPRAQTMALTILRMGQ